MDFTLGTLILSYFGLEDLFILRTKDFFQGELVP